MAGDRAAAPDVDDERTAVNLRRTRVMLPVMIAFHAAWAIGFASIHAAPGGEEAWRDGVVAIHAVSGAFVAILYAILRRGGDGALATAIRRSLGEIITVYALAVGTAVSVNTLNHDFAITAWIMAVMLVSAAIYARLAAVLIGSAVSVAVLIAASFDWSATNAQRLRLISNLSIMSVVGLVLSRLLYASFARETGARRALETLNLELERRVAAQVGEIVAHAERIEGLNRQLSGQVQARSLELSAALQRLAAVQHGEDTLRPGAVIGDRFEVAHVLGVGGMGVVYAAFDRVSRNAVAVKLVHGNLLGVDAAFRFLQEANATASLSHPAIVRILHVDVTDDGRLYQVQELVDGRTLDAWTDLDRTVPPPMVARLGAVLADALATAHAEDIIHRDVKPQNVMLTPAPPGVRLLDFGLAKLRRSMGSSELTEAGTVLGTPQFLAPEQIMSPATVAGPADVYALGIVLYLCVAGRFPFDATAPLEWLQAHAHLPPIPLDEVVVPRKMAALLMACLAKDPAARPTARALADGLAALADELGAGSLELWAAREDRGETRPLVLVNRRT